jgi:RNA 2',3'-cyclic 3'-phosphodiesterase
MKARRLFAGVRVEATEELRARMSGLQQELRGERIRWTRLENLHLTVEFFGETEEARVPELEQALAQAAAGAKAFKLKLTGLGTFGGVRHPRVLWLGVESEGLKELHGRVEAALHEAGREPEAREFAPHLTLGRIDRLKDAERFAEVVEGQRAWTVEEQAVRELILFESVGGRYVPIGRWPLMV